jgi:hypothetical protein
VRKAHTHDSVSVAQPTCPAEKTFKKAMEVSTSSFNNGDLDACFDDVKDQYGTNLGKLLKTLVSRNDSAITVRVAGCGGTTCGARLMLTT